MKTHVLKQYVNNRAKSDQSKINTNFSIMEPTVLTEAVENSDYDDFYPEYINWQLETDILFW